MITFSELATLILNLSDFVSTIILLILELSCFVGQTIVNQLFNVIECMKHFLAVTNILLQIVYEDSLVFLQDLTEELSCILNFVINCISHLRSAFNHTLKSVYFGLMEFNNVMFSIKNYVIHVLFSSIILVKTLFSVLVDGVQLIGSSIWLACTKIPLAIISFIREVADKIINIFYGGRMLCNLVYDIIIQTINDTFTVAFKAPFESFIGFVIGIILIYIVKKGYKTVCSITFAIFINFYHYLCAFINNLWTVGLKQRKINSGKDLVSNSQDRYMEDKLCVVCKDRYKEVIILPCKHVCLCEECSIHIEANQRLCPICRSNIQITMKVYM